MRKKVKKLYFKDGIKTINIPFILLESMDWQLQVKNQIRKIREYYLFRKDADIDFEINKYGAKITLSIK